MIRYGITPVWCFDGKYLLSFCPRSIGAEENECMPLLNSHSSHRLLWEKFKLKNKCGEILYYFIIYKSHEKTTVECCAIRSCPAGGGNAPINRLSVNGTRRENDVDYTNHKQCSVREYLLYNYMNYITNTNTSFNINYESQEKCKLIPWAFHINQIDILYTPLRFHRNGSFQQWSKQHGEGEPSVD